MNFIKLTHNSLRCLLRCNRHQKITISQGYRYLTCSFSLQSDSRCDNDDPVSDIFVNRNPRNLETMGIQNKRSGWPLQFPRRDYWHKLVFERTNRNTTAYVVHASGNVVVSASTSEDAIMKHLYSRIDVSASENIGRVLARRLNESGITEVMFDKLETPVEGPAVTSFVNALLQAGIELTEQDEIKPEPEMGIDYDRENRESS